MSIHYASVGARGKSSSLHSLELDPIELTIYLVAYLGVHIGVYQP